MNKRTIPKLPASKLRSFKNHFFVIKIRYVFMDLGKWLLILELGVLIFIWKQQIGKPQMYVLNEKNIVKPIYFKVSLFFRGSISTFAALGSTLR